ncbi:MAG: nitroreductase family protein [Bacteroidota bacterium]|nr:nitroreductase family protein [Bacteroidota bacterium]
MIDTILKRSSVRRYTDEEISRENLDKIIRAGFAAPTSHNSRPWHFIILDDKELMKNVGQNMEYAHMIEFANKAIIVCADVTLAPECWMLDCSAASENILLAAESLGIGACWTAVYPYKHREEVVKKFIPLPENIKPLCIIPLGYAGKPANIKDKYDSTRIHYNKFNW